MRAVLQTLRAHADIGGDLLVRFDLFVVDLEEGRAQGRPLRNSRRGQRDHNTEERKEEQELHSG